MKRILLALIALVLVDSGLGAVLRFAYDHVDSGNSSGGAVNGALAAIDGGGFDVIMLGSSTAHHGYDPREMEPILGARVYNAGSDGMWFDYVYGLMHLASTKQSQAQLPSLWVLNLDLTTLFQDVRSARRLAPRMDEDPEVRKLVEQTVPNPIERLRFHSQLVRYNGMTLPLMKELISPEPTVQGYVPLLGTELESLTRRVDLPLLTKSDAYQVQMLESLKELANQMGARLVFVIPPAYLATDSDRQMVAIMLEAARNLAQDLNVPLLDCTALTVHEFTNPNLFRDKGHLNHDGARVFSEAVARGLKPFL